MVTTEVGDTTEIYAVAWNDDFNDGGYGSVHTYEGTTYFPTSSAAYGGGGATGIWEYNPRDFFDTRFAFCVIESGGLG